MNNKFVTYKYFPILENDFKKIRIIEMNYEVWLYYFISELAQIFNFNKRYIILGHYQSLEHAKFYANKLYKNRLKIIPFLDKNKNKNKTLILETYAKEIEKWDQEWLSISLDHYLCRNIKLKDETIQFLENNWIKDHNKYLEIKKNNEKKSENIKNNQIKLFTN